MENMRGDLLSRRHRVLLYCVSIFLGFHLGEFGYVESIYHHEVAIQLTARKRIKVLGYRQQRRHTDSYSFCTFVFLPFCTLRQFASIPL